MTKSGGYATCDNCGRMVSYKSKGNSYNSSDDGCLVGCLAGCLKYLIIGVLVLVGIGVLALVFLGISIFS